MNEDKKIFLDELLDELSCYFDSDSEIVVEGDYIRIHDINYDYKVSSTFDIKADMFNLAKTHEITAAK